MSEEVNVDIDRTETLQKDNSMRSSLRPNERLLMLGRLDVRMGLFKIMQLLLKTQDKLPLLSTTES